MFFKNCFIFLIVNDFLILGGKGGVFFLGLGMLESLLLYFGFFDMIERFCIDCFFFLLMFGMLYMLEMMLGGLFFLFFFVCICGFFCGLFFGF